MSDPGVDDPRCPECGGPIGATATYCMHCDADLTDEWALADADADGAWDESATTGGGETPTEPRGSDGTLLDPEGPVDDALTVAVGIAGGIVAGLLGTFVLLALTESVWALPVGLIGWLVATAHLVRRRTVQGAVARSAYAVAIALALVPLVALGPSGGEDLAARVEGFLVLVLVVAVPAGIAGAVGYGAARFVPDAADEP